MPQCLSCIRRNLRILLADLLGTSSSFRAQSHYRRPLLAYPANLPSWNRRNYATESDAVESPSPPDMPPSMALYTPHKQRALLASQKVDRKSLAQELRYLGDPAKLADRTVSLLKQDDRIKAVELVKMASLSFPCTVSWNHIMDHDMKQGRIKFAIKTFNEMKKRGQLPDAHTFTILFRGLATFVGYPDSRQRAMALYESMSAENSPVKPSIIHTNAYLQVLSRHLEVDAMFEVAAKLPTHGPEAPNNLTFTTILNGIRYAAHQQEAEESFAKKASKRHLATTRGRRIWAEIIKWWKQGDLIMDEELVCAFGRLLLLGYQNQDCDDVLSLVEQTIGIPRQVPRLVGPIRYGMSTRSGVNDISRYHQKRKSSQLSPEMLPPSQRTEPVTNSDEPSGNEVDSFPLPLRKSYATPGGNVLSMVLDACIRLRLTDVAQNYWGILTSPDGHYRIAPDVENYHNYMRLLRVNRASRATLDLVKELQEGLGANIQGKKALLPKTFRIALSCCFRDRLNPTVLSNATQLIEIMNAELPVPDVKALDMYVSLARESPHSKYPFLRNLLRQSTFGLQNLKSLLNYGDEKPLMKIPRAKQGQPHPPAEVLHFEYKRDLTISLLDLCKNLNDAYAMAFRIGDDAMFPDDRSRFVAEKRAIRNFIDSATAALAREAARPQLPHPSPMPKLQGTGAPADADHEMLHTAVDPSIADNADADGPRDHGPYGSAASDKNKPWRRFVGSNYRPSTIFKRMERRGRELERRRVFVKHNFDGDGDGEADGGGDAARWGRERGVMGEGGE